MYIFALSGPSDTVFFPALSRIPIEIYTVHEEEIINKETNFISPVITTDGNIVFLPIGKEDALRNLQQRISSIATSQIHANNISDISIGSFAVVGTSFHLPHAPNISCEVYRVLTYNKPITEFVHMYASLKTYCENEESRSQIQLYFSQDLQKRWINNVILGIKQRLNWNTIVSSAIDEAYKEADKHKEVSEQKVRFLQIDEDGKIVR
jgi:hypothetical protein